MIITIIVMLILVGVTINFAINGGIITKSKQAASRMQIEADREALLSAVIASIGLDGKVDFATLDIEAGKVGFTGTNGTYTSKAGNTFTVDADGNITYTGEGGSQAEDPDLAYLKTLIGQDFMDLIADMSGWVFKDSNMELDMVAAQQLTEDDMSDNGDGTYNMNYPIYYKGKPYSMLIKVDETNQTAEILNVTTRTATTNGSSSSSSYINAEVEYGDFKYGIENGTASLKGLSTQGIEKNNNDMELETEALDVVEYNGENYTVTKVANSAFEHCTNLALTRLPSGLTDIGTCAFGYCTNLALTSLPNSLIRIGDTAFFDCYSLALTSLPSEVTIIENNAFSNCTNIRLTSLPNGITSIGYFTFSGCTNLALTSLPNGVTSIGNYAFGGCKNLTSINLPNGITSIGECAFFDCTNLALTSLPNSLTSIGRHAFMQCTNLALTSLPNSLTSMGEGAFEQCTNLALTSLPNSLTLIPKNAFFNCTNLALTSLPSSITDIGQNAFCGCTSINQLDLSGCPYLSSSSADYPWGLGPSKIIF